jgi:hypothetical protein
MALTTWPGTKDVSRQPTASDRWEGWLKQISMTGLHLTVELPFAASSAQGPHSGCITSGVGWLQAILEP